jgi:glucose-6-phosphate dehydrogenase assembly protein OpcA
MRRYFDPAEIEQELIKLQRQMSAGETRAALFNIVVFASEADRRQADEPVNFLLGKRAARVVHITNTSDSESQMNVSARCFQDEQNRGVCIQEIVVENGRDDAGSAPGTWTPLLIRDIPVYLFWLAPFDGGSASFAHAIEHADKVLIDSDHSIQKGESARSVLTAVRETVRREGAFVTDFSWKRLEGFRRAVARLFSAPEGLEDLPMISRVELSGLGELSGGYFVEWLAVTLDWTGPLSDLKRADGSSVDVETSSGEDFHIRFELDDGREYRCDQIEPECVRIVPAEGESATIPLGVRNDGAILLEEVDFARPDGVFLNVVERLS